NLYYERFVEMYPLDELTPRALFYFGMCHMMLTSTPDRSQKKTKMAIQMFNGFITRYPDHILAPTAAWNKEQMEAMLLRSRLDVARFYFNTYKSTAAIDRLKEYIINNPKSPDTPEALFMLGESFVREQSYRKAAEVFTMLIGDHPNDEWAQKAKESAARLTVKSN
ncbi:MAG: outer membrane protein assembly factor BamD, partial [Nitrospinota bacterium]|nr:outer membrane protein assembly factor BamD [Nitrospinota bacterium]